MKPSTLSGTTLTLLPVKSCLQVYPENKWLSYFIYSICAILANFLIKMVDTIKATLNILLFFALI